jgi:hypothetical protein
MVLGMEPTTATLTEINAGFVKNNYPVTASKAVYKLTNLHGWQLFEVTTSKKVQHAFYAPELCKAWILAKANAQRLLAAA